MNPGQNYLSAGDIPLPKVYGGSAVAYAVAAMAWLYMLTRNEYVSPVNLKGTTWECLDYFGNSNMFFSVVYLIVPRCSGPTS